MEHAGFPSEETLAAYIDGRLDKKTRRRVVAHIAECDECYALVVATAEFHAEEGIAPAAGSKRSRRLWIAGAGAVAALIALAVLGIGPIRERLHPGGTILLARSVGPHRHIDARLAGFPYQSLQATRGPSDLTADPNNWRLTAAAASVQKDATRRQTPDTLHALGVYYLLYGHFDQAVSTLQSALTKESGAPEVSSAIKKSDDAALLTDLAAAYEARTEHGGPPRDRMLAYETIDRALKLAPRSSEVLWNRALAIEGLNMNDDAAAAWDAYLRADPSSPWAAEARRHLRHLREPGTSELWRRERPHLEAAALAGNQDQVDAIVARFPFYARTWGEEELLPEWGRTRSAGTLSIARAVGRALDRTNGEQMLADCVIAIDCATGPAREALAAGHVAYIDGWQRFEQHDTAGAKTQLTLAADKLAAGESTLAALARLHLAACSFMENRYDAASSQLVAVQQLEAAGHHYALLGRAWWLHGLIEEHIGHPYEALAYCKRSLDIFRRLREEDSQAALDGLIGEMLTRLGESDEAFRHEMRALRVVAATGNTYRYHRLVVSAAETASDERYTAAAELLLSRLVVFDAKHSTAAEKAETLQNLGIAYARGGRRAEAENAVRQSDAYVRLLADAPQRERFSSFALPALLGSGAASMPQTTVGLSRAIDYCYRTGARATLVQLYADRGEVWRQEGRPDRAERDFERSIEEAEAERARTPETFFPGEPPFDSMLRLLIDEHRYAGALLVADRGNVVRVSRSVPTHLSSAVSLQMMLPRDVVLVACHVTGDRMMIWTVTRDQIVFHQHRADRDDVRSTIAGLLNAVATAARPDDLRPSAVGAGRMLLASWIDSVPPGATIVFVPDGVLDNVPFAALINPATNRFLIEEHPLAMSGSMAAFVRCMTTDRVRRDRAEPADVLFASPAPPQMERLPFSEGEIDNASAVWERHTTLHGGATKSDFLDRSRQASIIHFAGHAMVSELAPMKSALVFRDSLLYLDELSEKAFDHARLFVLAACSTGRQPRPGISLAAALTAQSVPSVVASLWDADDHSSAVLFTRFHQELRRGAGRATALQHAQLSLLFAADPDLRKPASWAGFQMIGAVEPIVQERNDV